MKHKYKPTKNRLDKVFSEYIRKRDGQCICCGSKENPNNGHFISRKILVLRWNVKNCNQQCSSCNVKHNDNTVPYTKAIVEKYGEGVLDELNNLAKLKVKYSVYQLLEMIKDYKKKIEELDEKDLLEELFE